MTRREHDRQLEDLRRELLALARAEVAAGEARWQRYIEVRDLHWEAHRREHATLKAETGDKATGIERRLDAMNELRQQITSERGEYATKDMLAQRIEALGARMDEKFDALGKRTDDAAAALALAVKEQDRKTDDRLKVLEQGTRYQSGQFGGMAMVGGLVLTLAIAAASLLLHFAK